MSQAEPRLHARLVHEREKLLALARRLVDEDADDLVQDAVATALAQDQPPRVLAPWLRQVIRNSARGRTRRAHTRSQRLLELVEPAPAEPADLSLDHARLIDALVRALASLDEPYRSTVHRRFFDDLSPLEIARADGDPPATVRWRLHEGLRRIRADLDARFGSRREWCSGLVVLALPSTVDPVPATGAPPMTTTMIAKLVALLGGVGLVVAFASTRGDDADAAPPSLDPAPLGAPATVLAAAVATPAATELESLEPGADAAVVDTEDTKRDLDFEAAIIAATETCLADDPPKQVVGKPRVEVEVSAWTLEDGAALIETVDVTSGRQITCVDDVAEDTPLDAPGVVVLPDLATCVAATIELDRIRPMRDEFGRVAVHDHPHPSTAVIPLDEKGRVDRAAVEKQAPEPVRLPDVSDEAAVDPEQAVAALGLPQRGHADAAVRIVECGSYECRFCKKSEATLAELDRRRSDVTVAFMHFPLSQSAARLAFAAVAAQRQDRFWDMHRALFEHNEPLDRAALVALAQELGLDVARFERDLDDPATEREVARQRRVCEAAGVFATPTFFLNGDLFRGELGIDALEANIAEVLADAE